MFYSIILIFIFLSNCVHSLKLEVGSRQVHTKINVNTTIMCKADRPLEDCQFTWKNRWSDGGPLIDFKRNITIPYPTTNEFATSYSYSGAGLQHGDCGITIQPKRWTSRIVSCRARTANGKWVYDYAFVTVDSLNGFPMSVSPSKVVAKVGDNVKVTCKTENEALVDCVFSLKNNRLMRFNLGHNSPKVGNVQYAGEGLEKGECGILIERVALDQKGWVLCSGKTNTLKSFEILGVPLIIGEPPTSVDLQVDKNPIEPGGHLKATCTVDASHPPPNITWYFGSEVLTQHQEIDENDDWAWVDKPQRTVQSIERNVTLRDDGKELRCTVDHFGLANTILKSQRITVIMPPECPPLTSASMFIVCVWKENFRDCHMPSVPGTVAKLQCKTGFVAPVPHPGYTDITCMNNGEWSHPLYKCIIDCGRRNTNAGETLIHGGYLAKIGEFPWHVAIYEKMGNAYRHICGGSLTTPDTVLSAAHCFWDNQLGATKDKSLFKIAAGKFYREIDAQEDIQPQFREAKKIIIPERYKGRDSNFAQDIAQVRLSSPVDISNRVSTICIDWTRSKENLDLSDGVNATVAGWGFSETGEQSNELKAVDLPFIPYRQCYLALPQLLKQLLTDDKFCAGYFNRNISLCRGDSGGGLAFYNEKTERYFIRGIVSIAFKPPDNTDKCYAQLYTAFTHVSRYHDWLQRLRYED